MRRFAFPFLDIPTVDNSIYMLLVVTYEIVPHAHSLSRSNSPIRFEFSLQPCFFSHVYTVESVIVMCLGLYSDSVAINNIFSHSNALIREQTGLLWCPAQRGM